MTKDERDLEVERLEREELDQLMEDFVHFDEIRWEKAYWEQVDAEFKERVYSEADDEDLVELGPY